ncbi:aminotransferase, class III [Lysobacter enzymogenes]|uniref:Aminotransferase, class III n=1 Tax=Lysobacter enzymogenes TaxID=69 RepID=A0A0S2DBR7_LYSEN|nr:aspartate aminotransferase family protein [Lysobacter enzymogenes]ALN55921.1 aminotransferase, class III [Lysobacter enzymogenes]QCW24880.1 aspartate aminotransferase family protein [Lysobacter enzymogenes]
MNRIDETGQSPASNRAGATDARSAAWRDDRRHVLHSWSAQALIDPVVVAGAQGSWFWDEHGTRWLDFSSQLVNVNLGHQHPALVEAIRAQAATLCTIAPYHANEATARAARMIAEVAPGDLDRVFFTNGGAEAVENAVRIARQHTGRHKLLSMYRSYHGATAGAIALTGDPRRWNAEPGPPGVVRFWGPYAYRSSFHARDEAEEGERALAHLQQTLELEGPHTVAAILLESVVGGNGILVPPDGYLQGVRDLCDRHGIVLIADEVMAGFGRCGEWFAIDRWGVVPDLITFAKGVNCGYVPLGGVIVSERIAQAYQQRPFPGGLTYSGHPLACAAAVACIGVYRSEGLIERARRIGAQIIGPALAAMRERHASVGEVRGLGAFWAIELVRDRATRAPLVPFNAACAANAPMAELVAACKRGGVWPFAAGNRLHIVPPLNIDEADLRHGLAAIDEALSVADRYAVD